MTRGWARWVPLLLLAGCARGDRAPLVDYVAQGFPFRVLRADGTVDVGHPPDRVHLVSGWYGDEGSGSGPENWAWLGDGPGEANLVLAERPAGGPVRLELDGWAAPGRDARALRVDLNGAPAGKIVVTPAAHTHVLTLEPGGPLPVAGINRLRLTPDSADRPSDAVPGAEDARLLSVAVQAVRLVADEPQRGVQWVHRVRIPEAAEFRLAGRVRGATRVAVRVRPVGQGAPDETLHAIEWSAAGRETVDLSAWSGRVVDLSVAVPGDGSGVEWERLELRGEPGGVDAHTSVVLIVIDTLRADFLSCYGALVATPEMDRLARRGVLFRRAYSHVPATGPAHASLFTSRYPAEHSVENNIQRLDDRFPTLASRLRGAWRTTAGFISLGVLQTQFGFARGFDVYRDSFPGEWWKDATEVNAEIREWASARAGGPYFLFAHYSDPHEPYTAPTRPLPSVAASVDGGEAVRIPADGRRFPLPLPGSGTHELELRASPPGRYLLWEVALPPGGTLELPAGWEEELTFEGVERRGPLPAVFRLTTGPETAARETAEIGLRVLEDWSDRELAERYAEEVAFVDRQIGELFRELDRHSMLDSTLVVLTSDHGEAFGEHGLVGHIDQLYDPMTRVPLILSHPGRLRPEVAGALAQHVDILPTVLDFLGLEPDPEARGRSLLARLGAREAAADPPVFGFTFPPEAEARTASLVTDRWKYIRDRDRDTEELYDLREDPAERRNVLDREPELAASARARLDREEVAESPVRPEPVAISDEERERLRTLGYTH